MVNDEYVNRFLFKVGKYVQCNKSADCIICFLVNWSHFVQLTFLLVPCLMNLSQGYSRPETSSIAFMQVQHIPYYILIYNTMYVNVNCNGNKNTFVLVIVRYTIK